jgi:glyoxylase-like metal-dependent hydrolase (beta-lactamase superfamily II)
MNIKRTNEQDVVRPAKWWENLPRPVYNQLERIKSIQTWFEVYKVEPDIYVFYEPGQFEEAISYLVLGKDRAALVDTGCGIGNIKFLVEEFTDLPVLVVNTHCHNDHVAQNYLFDEVVLFDESKARRVAREGISHDVMVNLLAEGLLWKPLPKDFNREEYRVPSFNVTRWLHDGDIIKLGRRELEVVHTPGHSSDSICLLDRKARLFWTGDMFYTGAIYTHLPGGDLDKFIESYRKMISLFPHYDRLMPSHNEPWIGKEILCEVLRSAEDIREGKGVYVEGKGGKRRYNYTRFTLITAHP